MGSFKVRNRSGWSDCSGSGMLSGLRLFLLHLAALCPKWGAVSKVNHVDNLSKAQSHDSKSIQQSSSYKVAQEEEDAEHFF
jgi:hypothetical protein